MTSRDQIRILRSLIREAIIREEEDESGAERQMSPEEAQAKKLAMQPSKPEPAPDQKQAENLKVANDLAQKMLSQGMPQSSINDMLKAAGKK